MKESNTREILDRVTAIHCHRLAEIESNLKEGWKLEDFQADLKSIAAHCLSVEKLLIEEASKLASTLPEFKQNLLASKFKGEDKC